MRILVTGGAGFIGSEFVRATLSGDLPGVDGTKVTVLVLRPASSDRFPRPAHRPASSVLDHGGWARAGIPPLTDWRPMLADALDRPSFTEIHEGPR